MTDVGDMDEGDGADVESRRVVQRAIGDEVLIVYDSQNHRAWVQSPEPVALETRR